MRTGIVHEVDALAGLFGQGSGKNHRGRYRRTTEYGRRPVNGQGSGTHLGYVAVSVSAHFGVAVDDPIISLGRAESRCGVVVYGGCNQRFCVWSGCPFAGTSQ